MEQLEKDIIKIIMKEMIYNNNDIDPKKVQECLYSLKDKDDDYEDKIEFDSLKSKEEKIIHYLLRKFSFDRIYFMFLLVTYECTNISSKAKELINADINSIQNHRKKIIFKHRLMKKENNPNTDEP